MRATQVRLTSEEERKHLLAIDEIEERILMVYHRSKIPKSLKDKLNLKIEHETASYMRMHEIENYNGGFYKVVMSED